MNEQTENLTENNDESRVNVTTDAPKPSKTKGKKEKPDPPVIGDGAEDAMAAHAAALDAAEKAARNAPPVTSENYGSSYASAPASAYAVNAVLPKFKDLTLRSPVASWVTVKPRTIRTAYGNSELRQTAFHSTRYPCAQERALAAISFTELPQARRDNDTVHARIAEIVKEFFITPVVNPMDIHSKVLMFGDGSTDFIPVFPCSMQQEHALETMMYSDEPSILRSRLQTLATRLRREPDSLQELFVATTAAFGNPPNLNVVVPPSHRSAFMHRSEYRELLVASREYLSHVETYDAKIVAIQTAIRRAVGLTIPVENRHISIERSKHLFTPFNSVRLPNHEQFDVLRRLHDKRCLSVDMYQTVRALVSQYCSTLLSTYTVGPTVLENLNNVVTVRTAASANVKYVLRLGTSMNMHDFYTTLFTWYICGRGIDIELSPTPDLPDLDLMVYLILRCFVPDWAIRHNSEYVQRIGVYLAGVTAWLNTAVAGAPGVVTAANTILAFNAWVNTPKGVAVGAGNGVNAVDAMPANTAAGWAAVVSRIGDLLIGMKNSRSTYPAAMKAVALVSDHFRSADLASLLFTMGERAADIGDRYDTHTPVDYTAFGYTVFAPGLCSVLTLRPEGILSAIMQTLRTNDHESLRAINVESMTYTKERRIYAGIHTCRADEAQVLWSMVCWLIVRFIDVYAAVRVPIGWYNPVTELAPDEQDLLSYQISMTIVTECFENAAELRTMLNALVHAFGGMVTPIGGPATALAALIPAATQAAVRPLYVPQTIYWEDERIPAYEGYRLPTYPGLGYLGMAKRITRVVMTKLSRCSFVRLFPPTATTAGVREHVPYALVYNASTSEECNEWDDDDAEDEMASILPGTVYPALPAAANPHGYSIADYENSRIYRHSSLRGAKVTDVRNIEFTAALVMYDEQDATLGKYISMEPEACSVVCKASADLVTSYHEVIGSMKVGLGEVAKLAHTSFSGLQLVRYTSEGGKYHKFTGALNLVVITTDEYHSPNDPDGVPVLQNQRLMDAIIQQEADRMVVVPTLAGVRSCFSHHHTTFGPVLDEAAIRAREGGDHADVDDGLADNAARSFDGSEFVNADIVSVKLPVPHQGHPAHWSAGSMSEVKSYLRPFSQPDINAQIETHCDSFTVHSAPALTIDIPAVHVPTTGKLALMPGATGGFNTQLTIK